MLAVDPRDPVAVATALQGWAQERFGGEVDVVGAPTALGGGFDSFIHTVELAGDGLPAEWRRPLVVRLLPSPDRMPQARQEAEVQAWCADQGYTAPAVHAVLAPDELFGLPAQVMERAGGVTVLDALKARPWRARALVDQLADLQLRLHALEPAGWPGASDPAHPAEQRLALARRALAEGGHPELEEAFNRVSAVVPIATAGPPVICHGDFHPLNVMVDGEASSVLDWTDACLAPREADVARTTLLLSVASIAAERPLEKRLLRLVGPRLARRYQRRYERRAPLDPERLQAWVAIQALQGWAQVLLLHAGGFDGETSAEKARVPAEMTELLHARIEEALAG